MQKISGKIVDKATWKTFLNILPYREEVILNKTLTLPPNWEIKPEYQQNDDTVYQKFLNIYITWHEKEENIGITPNITKSEGASLKKIIKYLYSITQSMDESLDVWMLIFQNWEQLDQFHQKLTKLTQIFSYITPILIQIKENAQSYR